MRVSTLKADPGYREDAYAFSVTLDGKEVKGCVTADEEAGECHVVSRARDGKLIPVDGQAKTEIQKGVVVISRRSP